MNTETLYPSTAVLRFPECTAAIHSTRSLSVPTNLAFSPAGTGIEPGNVTTETCIKPEGSVDKPVEIQGRGTLNLLSSIAGSE